MEVAANTYLPTFNQLKQLHQRQSEQTLHPSLPSPFPTLILLNTSQYPISLYSSINKYYWLFSANSRTNATNLSTLAKVTAL